MIEALLVVDREGRSLLLAEGRQTFPFAAGALQRDAARDHGRTGRRALISSRNESENFIGSSEPVPRG